jgi:hypothetical protein
MGVGMKDLGLAILVTRWQNMFKSGIIHPGS